MLPSHSLRLERQEILPFVGLMERNFDSKVPGPERKGKQALSLFLCIRKEAPGLKPFLSLRTG